MNDLTIANAHFVTDALAVGGDLAYDVQKAAAQAIELADSGITHVLDLRYECKFQQDGEIWEQLAVDYRWDGIDDAGQRVPGWWFDRITGWALQVLETPGAKILTHCHMGINRGPTAGFAVLLALGWDPVDALDAIRQARPAAAIGYAEDAVAWRLSRTGASTSERQVVRARVAQWRRQNPHDTIRIIREIRMQERASWRRRTACVGTPGNTQRIVH